MYVYVCVCVRVCVCFHIAVRSNRLAELLLLSHVFILVGDGPSLFAFI